MFKGKTLLITGGTGSFGHAVLNRFLDTDIGEIRIFSRNMAVPCFSYGTSLLLDFLFNFPLYRG